MAVRGLDKSLFDELTNQLKARAITVKKGTLVDATIIASASKSDGDARWVKHKGKPAMHGFKAHVGADADTAIVEAIDLTPANMNDGLAGRSRRGLRGQRLPWTTFSRRGSREGRNAARSGDGDVGPRRSGNAGPSRCLEPANSWGARSHRKDIRNLETQLRASENSMPRPRQSRDPDQVDSHRVQPEADNEHRGGGMPPRSTSNHRCPRSSGIPGQSTKIPGPKTSTPTNSRPRAQVL